MSTRHTPHLGLIVAAVLFGATACSKGTPTKTEGPAAPGKTAPNTGTPGKSTPSTGTNTGAPGKKGTPKPGGEKGVGGTTSPGGTASMPGGRSRGPGATAGTGKPGGTPGERAGSRGKIVDSICADVKGSGGLAGDVEGPDGAALDEGATCLPPREALRTDDEIAAVLAAMHEADVSEGDLAAGKAREAAVREYAKLMVAAHTQAAEDDRVVWSRFGIKPIATRASHDLVDARRSAFGSLARERGEDFDRAYIRSQIVEHRRVIGILDRLLEETRNADVGGQIEKERALVASNLTLACFVLDEMNRGDQRARGRKHVPGEPIGRAVLREDA